MAASNLVKPPDDLKVNAENPSQEWKRWKSRFDIFLMAGGMSRKADPIKTGLLLNHIGSDGLDIYQNFEFAEQTDDQPAELPDDYQTVIDKFEAYFNRRDPQLMLREQFWYKIQRFPGQSFESWVRNLKEKASACKFADRDIMIRDKLVFSCDDESTKMKLYDIGANLTLQKTIDTISIREATRKELEQTKSDLANEAQAHNFVDKVSTSSRKDTHVQQNQLRNPQYRQNTSQNHQSKNNNGGRQTNNHLQSSRPLPTQNCRFCNRNHTPGKRNCPAADKTCGSCGLKGHFSLCCFRKNRISAIEHDNLDLDRESSDDETASINAVKKRNNRKFGRGWHINLQVGPKDEKDEHTWCIDTGAEVSVMPASVYRRCYGALIPSDRKLYGPGNQALQVKGYVNMNLSGINSTISEKVYIVKTPKLLLGAPAIQKLNLIRNIPGAFSVRAIKTAKKEKNEEETQQSHKVINISFESEQAVKKAYPRLFQGLGKLDGEQHITVRNDAKPFCQTVPRRVPIPLLEKVESELNKMVETGVISPVNKPTDWCSPIVCVPKKNNNVRICVDLTRLNESVKREIYAMPSVEETLSKIATGKVFSKLDANSGFHQIKLDEESSDLTTFITPFGRYKYNRLPYGISSAPEYFQKRMDTILEGLDGVVCHMDDILIYGIDRQEHDRRLKQVLDRINESGMTLNEDKFEFAKTEIEYLGQVIDQEGLKKDPKKVKAILEMKTPENVSDVRRFLGMVNQQMKFLPNLAEKTKPLRDLLHKENDWIWDRNQEEAFNQLKKDLSTSETLALYNPKRATIVSADSSSFGLGACLRQRLEDGRWKPVAYASRSLTETERRYAQIEKEALAITWACEHWTDLLTGMQFEIESDHKPLIPLLSTKLIHELPLRVQRFRMRLLRYSFTIRHVPGKELYTADALSRAPQDIDDLPDEQFTQNTEAYINAMLVTLPVSDQRIEKIRQELKKDETLRIVMYNVENGWPEKNQLSKELKQYLNESTYLSVHDGLLMRENRLVIPSSMREEVLFTLHDGHQGIVKTKENAAASVWYPGITKDIELMIKTCPECAKYRKATVEPMLGTPFPERPWQRIATDFFIENGQVYLLVVDYYSRDIEIFRTSNQPTSSETIRKMKAVFSRHGICDICMSDNGPQYSSREFADFAKTWGFDHITSSPKYAQSNGEIERAVQTVKRFWKKCDDVYLGLLMYRNTPLKNGFSPAQLSMGRSLKTRVPCHPKVLTPKVPNAELVRERERVYRKEMATNYDRRHRTGEAEQLEPGDRVWIPDLKRNGQIIKKHFAPRSFLIQLDGRAGVVRRNRQMVRKLVPPFPNALVSTRANRGNHRISDLPTQRNNQALNLPRRSERIRQRMNNTN